MFGREFDAQDGFAAFSTAKALEGLRVSRDGGAAGIVRVMEPHDVALLDVAEACDPDGNAAP